MVGSVAMWFLFLPLQGEGQDGDGVFGLTSHCAAAEQHSRAGGSRRGLSERKARVPQPPGSASSAGDPEGAVELGRLLLVSFSWRSKKSDLPPGSPGTQTSAKRTKPQPSNRTTAPLHPSYVLVYAVEIIQNFHIVFGWRVK